MDRRSRQSDALQTAVSPFVVVPRCALAVRAESHVLKSHVHPAQYVNGVRTSMWYLQTTCSVDLVIVLFRVDNTCHRSCDLVTCHTLCCI